MGDLPRTANFLNGPTKGTKYSSRYLLDESNHLYSRKKKATDKEFGRHLWICLNKTCNASASTFSKEGDDEVKIVAFGTKKHDHVADNAKVSTKRVHFHSFFDKKSGR